MLLSGTKRLKGFPREGRKCIYNGRFFFDSLILALVINTKVNDNVSSSLPTEICSLFVLPWYSISSAWHYASIKRRACKCRWSWFLTRKFFKIFQRSSTIDQIVKTAILSHTAWTHYQGKLFLILADIRVLPLMNMHLGLGGLKEVFYGKVAHIWQRLFLCKYMCSRRMHTFIHLFVSAIHSHTFILCVVESIPLCISILFVLRFVPPDAHTPKYSLLVHK